MSRKFTSHILTVFAVLAAAPILVVPIARWHWLLDLATHFRVYSLVACAFIGIGLAVCRAKKRAIGTAIFCLGIGWTLISFQSNTGGPRTGLGEEIATDRRIRLASANLQGKNRDYDQWRDFVAKSHADIIVCLEVNYAWAEVLDELKEDYPYRFVVPHKDNFGVAILSKRDFVTAEELELDQTKPVIRAEFALSSGGTYVVYGAHPVPPMSHGNSTSRNRQLAAMGNVISRETSPVVLAGDLNCTPWSPYFTDLTEKTGLCDSRRGFGIQPSWHPWKIWWLGIPIDHVLTSPEIVIESRQTGVATGSDHLPVIVDILLPGSGSK